MADPHPKDRSHSPSAVCVDILLFSSGILWTWKRVAMVCGFSANYPATCYAVCVVYLLIMYCGKHYPSVSGLVGWSGWVGGGWEGLWQNGDREGVLFSL